MTNYKIITEKGEGNYSAYCPDLPGIVAAAETEEKTVELMKDAIEFHMEGLKDENLPSRANSHRQMHKSAGLRCDRTMMSTRNETIREVSWKSKSLSLCSRI